MNTKCAKLEPILTHINNFFFFFIKLKQKLSNIIYFYIIDNKKNCNMKIINIIYKKNTS